MFKLLRGKTNKLIKDAFTAGLLEGFETGFALGFVEANERLLNATSQKIDIQQEIDKILKKSENE